MRRPPPRPRLRRGGSMRRGRILAAAVSAGLGVALYYLVQALLR
ncbi:hypothetical protein [Phenylobacterium sp.]